MVYLITMINGATYKLYLEELQVRIEFEDWLVNTIKPDLVCWEDGVWISKRSIAYVERKDDTI